MTHPMPSEERAPLERPRHKRRSPCCASEARRYLAALPPDTREAPCPRCGSVTRARRGPTEGTPYPCSDSWHDLPPDTREEGLPSDKEVARLFHEAYERLAPRFGYRTRHESAKPWTDVPATNKALMAATVHEVRAALASTPRPGLDVITGTRNDVSPDG